MSKIDIRDYGYTEFFEDKVKLLNVDEDGLVPARITEVQKEQYKLISENGENAARLKGSLFYNDKFTNVYPAVGDFVLIKPNTIGEDIIYQVLDRKSKFSRMDTWNEKEQLVAVNFDYVFIMASLNYDFNLRKIERYITAAWQSGGSPVIVLTKADLCEDYSEQKAQLEEIAFGIPIICISSFTGQGLDELSTFTQPGKTIVFLGSSGVGKSSLVNAFAKNEIMKVNDIREDDSKGRHTTTHRELIMLDSGTMIIDTPGMRELGMWDVSEGIESAYSEIETLAKECKFNDCTHKSEPGCAVKEALANGTLSEDRFNNYLKIKREMRFAQSKEDKKIRMENSARSKSIAKYQRSIGNKKR